MPPFYADTPQFVGLRGRVYKAHSGGNVYAARHLPAVCAGRSRQLARMLKEMFDEVFVKNAVFKLPKGMENPIAAPLAHAAYVESSDRRWTFADVVRGQFSFPKPPQQR
jgi:hypothetical protein